MASHYLISAKEIVKTLQDAGADVGLRNYGRLWGVSTKDENYDYSMLFSPKELVIYLTGFRYAYLNRHRIKARPVDPPAPPPTADSQPVEVPDVE